MIKKVCLLLSSLFVVFGFGVSFANPIAPGEKPFEWHFPSVCRLLENVEIDNYRLIIRTDNLGSPSYNGERNFYIPKPNVCINEGGELYLVDKSLKVNDITQDNAIKIGSITRSSCSLFDCDYMDVYEIVEEGGEYKAKFLGYEVGEKVYKQKINKFFIARLMAIVIETIILFVIVKLFWKENFISNKRLLLFGILPTMITLPLLWFVLPLLLGDGTLYVIIGEILITIIEAAIVKYGLKISGGKAIIASIICNVASYGLGLLIL